ncbi:MAG: nitrogenase component 1 [bacterium]
MTDSREGAEPPVEGDREAEHGQELLDAPRPSRFPYLVGVYLATNAIRDAACVVDGPDCAFFKAEFIHGKHDLRSTLLDVLGNHRILVSHTTTDNIAQSRGQDVVRLIRAADAMGGVELVLVTSLPMVTIIGLQYDQLIRELRDQLSVELALVPGLSLQGDWLDGYAEVLVALAERIPAPAEPPAPHRVSIIGNFMDRNEEDHVANVAELRRLVKAMGLTLDSVWLSGRPWSELQRAAHSGTLVALPLGRRAAAALAERTGAQVLEVETPFGLARTADFLRALAGATNREEAAEQLVGAELTAIATRLEWAVPHFFLGLRAAVSASPDVLPGLLDTLTELGVEVVETVSPARRPAWFAPEELPGGPVAFDIEFDRRSWHGDRAPHLVVADSRLLRDLRGRVPAVELGFPSHADHALFERPFLGFRGHAAFVQRLISALSMFERPGR